MSGQKRFRANPVSDSSEQYPMPENLISFFNAASRNLEIMNNSQSNSPLYHTLRYDFKPASVNSEEPASLELTQTGQVTIKAPNVGGSISNQTVFRGQRRPHVKECVLIIDNTTGEMVLQKLTDNITVKATRSLGGGGASVNGGGGGGGGGGGSSSTTPVGPPQPSNNNHHQTSSSATSNSNNHTSSNNNTNSTTNTTSVLSTNSQQMTSSSATDNHNNYNKHRIDHTNNHQQGPQLSEESSSSSDSSSSSRSRTSSTSSSSSLSSSSSSPNNEGFTF